MVKKLLSIKTFLSSFDFNLPFAEYLINTIAFVFIVTLDQYRQMRCHQNQKEEILLLVATSNPGYEYLCLYFDNKCCT